MARFVCLLLLTLVSGILAQNPALWRAVRSANDTGVAEGRLLGSAAVATAATYQWIVFIYQPAAAAGSPATDYGPAAVIKANYIIASSDVLSAVTDANIKTLRVGTGTLTGDASSAAGLITRRIKSRVTYPTDSSIIPAPADFEKIAIFKVCPSFPSSDFAPAPTALAAAGDPLILVNYDPIQKSVTKTVGEDCECDEYAATPAAYLTDYVPKTFCGAEDATKKIETADKPGTIAIVNGKFGGFVSKIDKGELFIDYFATLASGPYATWVTGKTT